MPGVFLWFGIAMAGFVAYAIWRHAARRRTIAAWAAARGLSYDPARDRSFDRRFPGFGCLERGHSRFAHNIAEGDWNGRRVVTFDYRYQTGSDKSEQTHHFSGIVMQGEIPLRPLFIRPERGLDKLGEFLGIEDIDFESSEFSRSFYVKSPDKRWAYDVIHPRTMEFLMSMPRYSIEFLGAYVMVWGHRWFAPDEIESAIAVAEGLLDRLPEYVRRASRTEGR